MPMSYRAFKRLLGETSLERKCRWLLGAGVLLLMTGSFWVYAQQTESLAYEQLDTPAACWSPTIVPAHVKHDRQRWIERSPQGAWAKLTGRRRSRATALDRSPVPTTPPASPSQKTCRSSTCS